MQSSKISIFEDFSRYHNDKLKAKKDAPKPFVKWVGGKRNIMHILKGHLPQNFNRYFEPFLGGGALFFELLPTEVYLSDINRELITTYLVIKDHVYKLLEKLQEHENKHSKEYFYQIRKQHFLTDPIELASRFIYLNKTCYNGVYRVNKKGEFNVPMGRYNNPSIYDKNNLLLVSQSLQNAFIENIGFLQIKPKKGDFVYFDPPYHQTYSGYDKVKFDEAQQRELRDLCNKLNKQGVYFMLSNSSNCFIKSLYKKYCIYEVNAPRYVNCKSSGRKNVQEVIITNYETNLIDSFLEKNPQKKLLLI